MSTWTPEELAAFAPADDFHVSPFREDGATYGTPTFIWSVVADGDLYVRPYNGSRGRWYQAAIAQGAGRISITDTDYEVTFTAAVDSVLDAVDQAYRDKYSSSQYLAPMIAFGPRAATVKVLPSRTEETTEV